MADIIMKRGDKRPPVVTQLLTEDGEPLASASVTKVLFICKRLDSSGRLTPHISAEPDRVEEGTYRYSWGDGETDIAGDYIVEWEVTYTDDTVRTFPTSGYNHIVILPDLGGDSPD